MKRVTARKKLRVKLADIKEWLNRRSQRKALTWEKFNLMDERFPLPRPRTGKPVRAAQGPRTNRPVMTACEWHCEEPCA